MKKFFTNKYVLITGGIIFLFLLCFIISLCFNQKSNFFPSPIFVLERTVILLGKPYTYQCLGFSMIKMVIGFAISLLLALIFACIVNDNESRYQFFLPFITTIKSVPTAAFIFLLMVLIGSEFAPAFIVIFFSFPILYESIVGGMRSIDDQINRASTIDGANSFTRLFRIQLPLAMPSLIIGIISSFSLSFKVEIMSEVITGYTKNGLGSLIKGVQVADPTNLADIFAYSLIAVILMVIISIAANLIKNKLAVNHQISR